MAGPREFSTDRFALHLGLFYAAYFMFGGVQLPFFPLWLEARGLDPRTIGLVIAVPMVVRIVATPFISHWADRKRALKATIVVASMAATLGMTLLGLVSGVAAILLVFVISAVAFSPVLSLTDAYALNGLGVRGRAYGPVRLWGSVAFIVGNVGAGLLLQWIAPGHLIWLIVASLTISVMAAVTLVPLERAPPHAPDVPRPSPKTLLRNPLFLVIGFSSAAIQSSHALYYGFSTLQWRSDGYDGAVIGALWGLGVAAEVALFAVSARLPARLSPALLMVIGGTGAVLRWTAMAFNPPLALLPVLQLLHACSFAATHLGLMGFMARGVPRELAATGQGLIATGSGLVNASATFVSGLVYAALGSLAYLLMAGMALAGVLGALYARRGLRDLLVDGEG